MRSVHPEVEKCPDGRSDSQPDHVGSDASPYKCSNRESNINSDAHPDINTNIDSDLDTNADVGSNIESDSSTNSDIGSELSSDIACSDTSTNIYTEPTSNNCSDWIGL